MIFLVIIFSLVTLNKLIKGYIFLKWNEFFDNRKYKKGTEKWMGPSGTGSGSFPQIHMYGTEEQVTQKFAVCVL